MKPLPPVFIWTTACFASARAAGGTHSVFAIAVLTCVARLQILPPQSERASTYVAEFRLSCLQLDSHGIYFCIDTAGVSKNISASSFKRSARSTADQCTVRAKNIFGACNGCAKGALIRVPA
jgi:hypothetical protein